ncbi:hypothetical protein [Flavobacterium sp. ENC]|uniref:hypothetical protein n=1 Tax=Flavobacterium sp. ENC TaxID=2897330 RepID=UPI001E3FB462|nr:hypothetical protein [Flavobacterium sp. ENC]MCD0464520.1 hypothetical protein [Flavobacterium sp. ENC]
MNTLLKKPTLFFVLGILSILAGTVYAIMLIAGNSAQDGLLGIYILFSLVLVLFTVIADRLLVRKFGNQKVNKVQFSFLLLIVLLWIMRAILNWL